MGYVLSILMNALRTWLLTKLWDSFFTRRFNGKQFWAYWLLWTAIITVVLNVLPNDYDILLYAGSAKSSKPHSGHRRRYPAAT